MNMNLLVDIGNTTVAVGIFKEGKYFFKKKYSSKSFKDDEIPEDFLYLLKKSEKIGVSSVVPSISKRIKEIGKNFNLFFIEHEIYSKLLEIDYETVETLGSDRVINAYGAKIFYGFPSVVIDIGSAITFDVVGKSGAFLGGAIFAGNEIISKALSLYAERLFEVNFNEDIVFKVGHSSYECLETGIYFSTMFAIEGFIREYKRELNEIKYIILTGGGAKDYKKRFSDFIYDPLLTLKGINLAIEKWAK